MSSRSQNIRLIFTLVLILGVGLTSWLIIRALEENISLYYTPSDYFNGKIGQFPASRFGGVVKKGSLERSENLHVRFILTDYQHELPVVYNGVLPDLFKEGQGVVVTGFIDDQGVIEASDLLAKHDENYMPPNIKQAQPGP